MILYWWFYRQYYRIPHRDEVDSYFGELVELSLLRKSKKYFYVKLYCLGFSIEEIGMMQGVTRERVRQCIWNVYRELERKRYDKIER